MPKYLDESGLTRFYDNIADRPVHTFDTVAEMQAATYLEDGMTCHTNGFHAAGDGGAAYYTVSMSGTANGMDVLALQDGLFATLVVTEPYVTPEQFGAYGDGTHDDSRSIKRALALFDSVRLLGKTYYCTETIALSMSQKLLGLQDSYGDTILSFPADVDGISITGRGVEIGGFRLVTTEGSTAKAITFAASGVESHWISLHDINVFDFGYGIYSQAGTLWDATFHMLRINGANVAISLKSGFNMLFEDVYTNDCSALLDPGSASAKFLCCNFGITSIKSFAMGTNARLSFDTCNFECDSEVTGSGYVFGLGSGWYEFSNCTFKPNFPSQSTSFFAGTGNTYSAIFRNCHSNPLDTAYGNTNFFAKGYPIGGSYGYGALKIIGCGHEFPRPDYYNASLPNLIDYDRGGIAHFWGATESDMMASGKIPIGAILMNDLTKTLCYYNGTSLIYLS